MQVYTVRAVRLRRQVIQNNVNLNLNFMYGPYAVNLNGGTETGCRRCLAPVQQGEELILTYRGKPAARLTPYTAPTPQADDPLYRLSHHATPGGESLQNEGIDAIVYGR